MVMVPLIVPFFLISRVKDVQRTALGLHRSMNASDSSKASYYYYYIMTLRVHETYQILGEFSKNLDVQKKKKPT